MAEPQRTTDDDSPAAEPQGGQLSEQFLLRLDMTTALLPPPNPDRILKKAVQAIHSYPTNGEHTITTRKLLNALVAHAQDVFAKMSPDDRQAVKSVRGTPLFRIPIKRLLVLMGSEASNNYGRVYEALDAIFQWDLRWNLMADSPTGGEVIEEVTSRLISQWSKGTGERYGWVTYEMPFDVLMLLLEPAIYARVDLRTVNALGSSYAIALYENCVRYLGTQNRVTAMLPVDEWVSIIAGVGKYRDPRNREQASYKDFNKYAVKPACAWLEKLDSCPFTVEPRVVYGPRKRVVGLQFKMHLKQQQSLGLEMPPTWDPKTVEVLKTVYSMPMKDIALLSRTASEAEVQEAIQRDSAQIAKKLKQGETVGNRAAYLKGILRNLQQGKPKDEEPEAEGEEVTSRSVNDAISRAQKRQEEFAAFRRERFKEMLLELPAAALEDLRHEFEEARGRETVVAKWLKAGWSKPSGGLMSLFVGWVMQSKPETVERMLARPEEKDFAVWLMWNEGKRDQE